MSVEAELHAFYERCPHLNLMADMRYFMHHPEGYIFARPDLFMMGCRIGAEVSQSGWFIYLAVGRGKFRWMVELMPYYLPYIGWARAARGHFDVEWHSMDRVIKLTTKLESSTEIDKSYEKIPIYGEEDREGILRAAAQGIRRL